MNESELRKYWSAYTDAWKLMKNLQMVNPERVAQMIKKQENPIMGRLFCLVVWHEIKRIKLGGTPLQNKQYEECLTGAWKLFKKYSEPNDTDEYWDGFVNMIGVTSKEYGNCSFISNLLIHVIAKGTSGDRKEIDKSIGKTIKLSKADIELRIGCPVEIVS